MSESKKTVFVVGLGPGGGQFLTVQAQSALQQAEVLCGYTVYIDLVRPLYPEKECYTTGMTREIDRCRWALDTAQAGRDVALVCSGDAGVYGMASPLLELAEEYPDVNVEVVPGLTAALSGGAVLGAPLAHDFCVISLSDRLTPWEVIEKRLACAAQDVYKRQHRPQRRGKIHPAQDAGSAAGPPGGRCPAGWQKSRGLLRPGARPQNGPDGAPHPPHRADHLLRDGVRRALPLHGAAGCPLGGR